MVMPLENAPTPSRKPKSYQCPVLDWANTVTSSHTNDPKKSNGAIMPCHTPPQNPYSGHSSPHKSADGVLSAHPDNARATVTRTKNKNFFIGFAIGQPLAIL